MPAHAAASKHPPQRRICTRSVDCCDASGAVVCTRGARADGRGGGLRQGSSYPNGTRLGAGAQKRERHEKQSKRKVRHCRQKMQTWRSELASTPQMATRTARDSARAGRPPRPRPLLARPQLRWVRRSLRSPFQNARTHLCRVSTDLAPCEPLDAERGKSPAHAPRPRPTSERTQAPAGGAAVRCSPRTTAFHRRLQRGAARGRARAGRPAGKVEGHPASFLARM